MEQIIGLDTSVFIYLLEEHPKYLSRAQKLLRRIERGEIQGVFSSLGLIEILTGPKKSGDFLLARRYRELISDFPHLTIMGMSEGVVEHASDLRATYGIATPDAIHLATAIDFGAGAFVTNDKKLQRVKEIKVEML